ncbi:MAG: tRNA (adenosine(37)-N6)-threonylcarbamoyltransferase complex dimerization subunit type 1 TsaB [Clostridia bacterium]|nr:tRNA (adenosine(37)-N6)-threonylcarbamoyltransferase complex dimerization subunit type 1 TsaB [Clostridia bacterium]
MKILAFDSTAKAASVALAEDGRVLAYAVANNGLTHSEILLPMAESVLTSAKVPLDEVDGFAVTVGPGSFTGVRIGVATVKGLAQDYDEPSVKNCIPVSTLAAIAEGLAPLDGLIVPVMDARRNEVYNAVFRYENGALSRLCPDRAISLADLGEELVKCYGDETIRLCGDGYEVAASALRAFPLRFVETPPLLRMQNAAAVATLACATPREEWLCEEELRPVYLRLPQAERDRLAKEENTHSTN